MNNKRIGRALSFFIFALSLSACASFIGLKAPNVSVTDIHFIRGSLFEQQFKLQLRIENPNDRDLVLNGLIFDLQLTGKDFVHGINNATTTVPHFGSVLVEVDATAKTYNLLNQLVSLKESDGHFDYRLKGEVMSGDFGRIPFDKKGQIVLPLWQSAEKSIRK